MPGDIHIDDRGKPSYGRGKKYPAWSVIAVPFIGLIGLLIKKTRGVCWKSVAILVVLFEISVFVVEHISVMKGHWVYNRNRILGYTVWEVPLEEPLIYYLFPPVMVVLVFHFIMQRTGNRRTREK